MAIEVSSKHTFALSSNSDLDSTAIKNRNYYNTQIGSIEFVSLKMQMDGYRRFRAKDDLFRKKHAVGYFSTILLKDSIDMTRFYERKFIDDTVRMQLEKVLFGTPQSNINEFLCYEPRNGILFYDKSNVLLGIMEICFECQGVRYSAGFPMRPEIYPEQFRALKKLFFTVGIRRGVEA